MTSVLVSIVSHGQLGLVYELLKDLRSVVHDGLKIVVTINIPEDESRLKEFSDLDIRIIRNSSPKGFGANHNTAFMSGPSDHFVVVNPDIRLSRFSFDSMLRRFDASIGACAPLVFSPDGHLEDSFRKFPTLAKLIKRKLWGQSRPDYQPQNVEQVDWVAGMFIVFCSKAFRSIGGFDERYFMYMEDADICRKLLHRGWRTIVDPDVSVIHDARRASRRSPRHFFWHVRSAVRFLVS